MYELPTYRDNPRTANIKGPVNKKSSSPVPLSQLVLSQNKLQLTLKALELLEVYQREITEAKGCGSTCRKLLQSCFSLQYKACAAEGCLLGRCQHQNIVIELPKYPENVFLFIILQYCKAQENLLLTLKQESQNGLLDRRRGACRNLIMGDGMAGVCC